MSKGMAFIGTPTPTRPAGWPFARFEIRIIKYFAVRPQECAKENNF